MAGLFSSCIVKKLSTDGQNGLYHLTYPLVMYGVSFSCQHLVWSVVFQGVCVIVCRYIFSLHFSNDYG